MEYKITSKDIECQKDYNVISEKEGVMLSSCASVMPFSVFIGETVYATCRLIEHASMIQNNMAMRIRKGERFSYE